MTAANTATTPARPDTDPLARNWYAAAHRVMDDEASGRARLTLPDGTVILASPPVADMLATLRGEVL